MLNLSDYLTYTIRSARLESSPWQYAHIEPAIPTDLANDLAKCFDLVPMSRCEQLKTAKTYRFSMAKLTADSPIVDGLWKRGLEVFDSQAYRAALRTLTSIELCDAEVTFNLWEYAENDWLSPHLDKVEKLVTQIIYLTQEWHEGAGGRLLILESNEPASAVRCIAPRFGASTILVRSESSWHAVEPVARGLTVRRSLTVTYWSNRSVA